ncbi:helix-turn-helix domain-containing protein [Pseudokineococcus marinus]|uniref:Helix-turn-helix domain-containing protein n=1 Tax=Pseudokineococcus marinus TaxID=351215 RepID=A0A849BLY8_9ACTN|nr:helix-turn-helix domain-containing protein [Pseudokineococcus marinus]
MSGPALLTTADAALLAGVSPATVRDWQRRGLLKARGRRGRSSLWAADDILDVEAQTFSRDCSGRTSTR